MSNKRKEYRVTYVDRVFAATEREAIEKAIEADVAHNLFETFAEAKEIDDEN